MSYPAKGRADYLALGDYNVLCGQCGRKRKASECRILPPGVPGSGLLVCYPEHWDARHPQEFVKAVPDNMSVPLAQPPGSVTPQEFVVTTQGGAANALVLTVSGTYPSGIPFPGQIFRFTATTTNTGAATARLGAGTAYDIVDADGAALTAGDITTGTVYYLTFDGLNSEWQLST